ncbi:MAG: hypothetical protein WAX07_04845 [Candidatus Altiarchaeia archaeon]
MDQKIIIGIMILICVGTATAEYEERMQEELQHANAAEKAGMYSVAASDYKSAANLAASDENYEKAIEYRLKAAEMLNKSGMSTAGSYGMIADYYARKAKKEGANYSDKIRENCEIEEKLLVDEINIELSKSEPSYTNVYTRYGSIVNCYKLLTGFNYDERTCKYCFLANEYAEKERKISGGDIAINDCSYLYDCPKSTTSQGIKSSDSNSSFSKSDNEGLILPALVVGFLILLVAGFLVSKGRKKGSKKA